MHAVAGETQARVKSAERVLDIFELLAGEPHGLSFTELQRLLGLPKSSLHQLLIVLTDRGYLELNAASRTYMLGIRVWESGQAYRRNHDLVREALPRMQAIVERVNETVQLAVLDGIENVYLAKVESSHALRLQSEVGRRLYAHATGLGKVLLAHLAPEQLSERLEGMSLPRFTPTTLSEETALRRELAWVAERGFAIDAEEYTPGLICVAVPVYQSDAQVAAALSVSVPVTRITLELLATALSLLAGASLQIARRLGCTADDQRLAAYVEPAVAFAALTPWFGDLAARVPRRQPVAPGGEPPPTRQF